jgi:hypothetical protein
MAVSVRWVLRFEEGCMQTDGKESDICRTDYNTRTSNKLLHRCSHNTIPADLAAFQCAAEITGDDGWRNTRPRHCLSASPYGGAR